MVKKSTIDTTLAMLCMLTPASPGIFAKKLVIVSTALLILRILGSRNLLYLIKKKFLILLLFVPSIIITTFNSPEELIRFVPVLLLVFGFPFYGFKVHVRPIMIFSICILAYFIVTQYFIAVGNTAFINFREVWYPSIYSEVWNYGSVDEVINAFRTFRAGGLYFNPNTLANVTVLYYFIFSVSSKFIQQKNINFSRINILSFVILVLVAFSIYFTGSRTHIVALMTFIVVSNFDMSFLKKGLIKKNTFWVLLFVSIFLFLTMDDILRGLDSEGSANIKFEILTNYLGGANFLEILFGGTYNIQFDNEYGNWIGSTGFFGMLAWFLILRMFYITIPSIRDLIFPFLMTSIGGTLFYGLLTGSIVIILLVIISSFWWQSNPENENSIDL
jgi:hypothetical protein